MIRLQVTLFWVVFKDFQTCMCSFNWTKLNEMIFFYTYNSLLYDFVLFFIIFCFVAVLFLFENFTAGATSLLSNFMSKLCDHKDWVAAIPDEKLPK